MAFKKGNYEKKDYRQELTDKVRDRMDEMIESIDKAGSWQRSWFVCNDLPYNPDTGTRYRGINVISLMSADFPDPRFFTYKGLEGMEKERRGATNDLMNLKDDNLAGNVTPADYQERFQKIEEVFVGLERKGLADRDKPIHVNKGATGTPIFKAVEIEVPVGKQPTEGQTEGDIITDEQGKKKIRVMAYSGTVFNASQIANIKEAPAPHYAFEPHQEADKHIEAMIAKTGLKVEHNEGGRACYIPSIHKIVMPNKDKFKPGTYYDTLLHEVGHSTGPALKRDMSGSFGDKKYAFEEFVAEISSNFMASELGIPHNPAIHENNAAYLKSWSKALQDDKNLIFKAAAMAQKSVTYQNDIRQQFKLELEQGLHINPTAKPEVKDDLSLTPTPVQKPATKPKPTKTLSL